MFFRWASIQLERIVQIQEWRRWDWKGGQGQIWTESIWHPGSLHFIMKAVRAHGGSDTGKLHDHTCCGKTWMADGRWLEGESLQRLIRKPLKTLEQQLLLGGGAEKKRKKLQYTVRELRFFYIHVQLFFRLKHFNIVACIVTVTMVSYCTQFWGYKNREAITSSPERLQTLRRR